MSKIISYARLECELSNERQVDTMVYAEYSNELMLWQITSYRDVCNDTGKHNRENIVEAIEKGMYWLSIDFEKNKNKSDCKSHAYFMFSSNAYKIENSFSVETGSWKIPHRCKIYLDEKEITDKDFLKFIYKILDNPKNWKAIIADFEKNKTVE